MRASPSRPPLPNRKQMMESTVTLKDGRKVLIRPMMREDIDLAYRFFLNLPDGDRNFLRGDVTDIEVVEQRYRNVEQGMVKRLIALEDDKIIADGALELADHGWDKHVGELRLVIDPGYQRLGLGMLLTRELYSVAAREKVEEIVVRMMAPQVGARHMFERLGFREEIVLVDYVKDRTGQKQNLILMRNSLNVLLRELESYLGDQDWSGERAD
jgi:ribosomal protein S18 acetylase RimI-like enzyme